MYGNPKGVQRALPHLTIAQIKVALDFYEKNKDEIDDYIREEETLASEFRGIHRFT